MTTFANPLTKTGLRHHLGSLAPHWQGLSAVERLALGAAPVLALALLVALAQACQVSVARGEQLRANQLTLGTGERVALARMPD